MKESVAKIDRVDKTILSMLIQDSRASLSAIAKKARVSKPTIHYRISALEKEKIILDYVAFIDMRRLGYSLYFILLETDMEHQEAIVKVIQTNPFVFAVIGLASPQNLMIATFARDTIHIHELLGSWSLQKGVRSVSLLPVAVMEFIPYVIFGASKKSVKERTVIAKVDGEDIKLLKALSMDSRQPLTTIAPKIGLSAEALAKRLNRLKEERIILSLFTNINIYRLSFQPYFVLVKLHRKELLSKIFSLVKNHASTNGQYILDNDYSIATVIVVPSILELRTFREQVLAIDSLAQIESHLITDQYYSNCFPEGVYQNVLKKY